ncbi:unnamed protein product [Lepeophtheirus salmonis]|uniref:(salmon louse) hypothetical protein n=1 Tax=Lepeophtheirus salmonis TaxID=72036 RepID=A0A7R8CNY7_LEPSM|nr:unnamed protein product [Lepeophtheirus salmonis]CAF2834155.1 unnamed protein product [Lepeophtheirus salmonis]
MGVEYMKAAVDKECEEMSEEFVKKTCLAFYPRIEAMLGSKMDILLNEIAKCILCLFHFRKSGQNCTQESITARFAAVVCGRGLHYGHTIVIISLLIQYNVHNLFSL